MANGDAPRLRTSPSDQFIADAAIPVEHAYVFAEESFAMLH
jgi:hypothetical protein